MTETSAGGAGLFVASAFTCINCKACGFWTPEAVAEKRPKPVRASWTRKTATLVIETPGIEGLAAESLAVENWNKDILQRGNLFPIVARHNPGRQLRPAKRGTGYRTWAQGWLGH